MLHRNVKRLPHTVKVFTRSMYVKPKGPALLEIEDPPGYAPQYEETVRELNKKDLSWLHSRGIDIGLPSTVGKLSNQELKRRKRFLRDKKYDADLEKQARNLTLDVPLEDAKSEWCKNQGPEVIKTVAEHFGIYRDLFYGAHFVPRVPLSISFEIDEDGEGSFSLPVCRGNVILPAESASPPTVRFESDDNSIWSLLLTNLDGHMTDNSAEYVHWFVANIKASDVNSGEEIVPYMQPIPFRGTGFHRYVFILFKQEKNIDYSSIIPSGDRNILANRSFQTFEFYEKLQNDITPAGLSFFQTEWDASVTNFLHEKLDCKEPVYEYQHRPMYINPNQTLFVKQLNAFDNYLNKHRNQKDVAEEIVRKRLSRISPFKGDDPRPKYPLLAVHPDEIKYSNIPSWKKQEIRKEKLGWVKFRMLYNPLAKWP